MREALGRVPNSDLPPNPEAIGSDMGVALDLFGGKLFARASYYEVDLQKGSNFGSDRSSRKIGSAIVIE